MLRKILDKTLSFFDEGKTLYKMRPLISAVDTFLYEPLANTKEAPHIRDAVDVKRWMLLVVFSLVPCIIWCIWNTGLQNFVYQSSNYHLMNEYLEASKSFSAYFAFAGKDMRYLSFIKEGLIAFLPVVIISYAVGGLWEGIFACIRGQEISEGFLVTGILYALILPSTIPYWMVAIGVSVGIILSKELFGGSGMNILNPALACRTFLYFSFPSKLSGDIWAGTNPMVVNKSIALMNQEAKLSEIDGYTQATSCANLNISDNIKRVHVDAIATNNLGSDVSTYNVIEKKFSQWNANESLTLGNLTGEQMQSFVTSPFADGGLGLSPTDYEPAYRFTGLNFGFDHETNTNFFFGNHLGSMGETSVLSAILGALFLIYVGIGCWRTMVAAGIGTYLCALIFQLFTMHIGPDHGAWNAARFAFPPYKELIIGGLAFGVVFMATDPVSSPNMKAAKWVYGLLIGIITIVIRLINPGFPEGVMLAILFGNVFAPLFDYHAVRKFRRRQRVRTPT